MAAAVIGPVIHGFWQLQATLWRQAVTVTHLPDIKLYKAVDN